MSTENYQIYNIEMQNQAQTPLTMTLGHPPTFTDNSSMEVSMERTKGTPMRSSNLRSLTIPKDNFRETIEKYLTSYFKHLIDLKDKMRDEYLDESVFTLLIKREDGKYYVEADNIRGKENVIKGLSLISAIKNYEFTHTIIQPGLGSGAVINIFGTADAGYPLVMNINLVRISKKYKILNQFIQIG